MISFVLLTGLFLSSVAAPKARPEVATTVTVPAESKDRLFTVRSIKTEKGNLVRLEMPDATVEATCIRVQSEGGLQLTLIDAKDGIPHVFRLKRGQAVLDAVPGRPLVRLLKSSLDE